MEAAAAPAFPRPPAVAFPLPMADGSVMVRPDGPAASSVPVAVCTTAPEPLVPDVSTPENSTMLHAMDSWPLEKLMVTLPAVGDAPIARNSVMRSRKVGLPAFQTAVLATTQVRPFPESVGRSGV